MTTLAPVSVALKFGFLAVLYLFLLWVVRSARRDLARRRGGRRAEQAATRDPARRHRACTRPRRSAAPTSPTARRASSSSALPGHEPGMIYDLDGDIVLGRGDRAEIRLEDPFASSRHARVFEQGNIVVIEDLDSTNGTYLNEELLRDAEAAAPRRPGAHRRERIRPSRSTEMLRVAEQYAGTDTGRQRRANEDSLLARSPLFVVADGMGGAQAGEVASRIAVESFQPGARRTPPSPSSSSPRSRTPPTPASTSSRTPTPSRRAWARRSPPSTWASEEVAIAHVGDSRAYCLRDGELLRLTDDHSLVDELMRQGRLTPEEAVEHPQRSVITRALGPEGTVEVDTRSFRARAGRRLPALQRRPDDDALRGGDRRAAARQPARCATPARR